MRFWTVLVLGLCVQLCGGEESWKLDSSAYTTHWAREVSLKNVSGAYPRPTMVRSDWQSLNGLWAYGITSSSETNNYKFTNQILVPFPIESVMAGTHQVLTELQRLWYRRTFSVPSGWLGRRIWLHFEAVDWEARVWVNNHELGVHRGGYDRFSFDITEFLKPGTEQELVVSVFDPTDSGNQPRGKQMLYPRPPYYHASSGIWQTVWLEPVDTTAVTSLKLVPDVDTDTLNLNVEGRGDIQNSQVEAIVFDGVKEVARKTGQLGKSFALVVPQAKRWSPNDPFLYDLKLIVRKGG